MQAFNRIGGPQPLPLAGGGKPVERERFVARLAQTRCEFRRPLLPDRQEGPIGLAGQGHGLHIDDPMIVGAQVVMRMSRDMAFQVAQLVHEAALDHDAWPTGLQGGPQLRVAGRSHRAGALEAPGLRFSSNPLSFLRSIRPGENAI